MRLGIERQELRMMDLSNRWASCSDNGILNFHWKILQLPHKYQRYLVAHEIAHIIEKHHTAKFWQTLERIMPDYEEYQSGLNSNAMRYLRMD